MHGMNTNELCCVWNDARIIISFGYWLVNIVQYVEDPHKAEKLNCVWDRSLFCNLNFYLRSVEQTESPYQLVCVLSAL